VRHQAIVVAGLVLLLLLAVPCFAQRGGAAAQPEPGPPAPRGADGKPTFGPPEGEKGFWLVRPGGGGQNFTPNGPIPYQPWAKTEADRRASKPLEDPYVNCIPSGGPRLYRTPPGFDIVEAPDLQRIYMVNIAGASSWRVIYMDGRQHPTGAALVPSYMGHSIGHWEGDTLVVDTVGFNNKFWLDARMPHTTQLHIVERITRTDVNNLRAEVTIDDPGAYTAPFTGVLSVRFSQPGQEQEIFEYVCLDDPPEARAPQQ
jgi:hypothetical protein